MLCVGGSALPVRLGPTHTLWSFYVVRGVGFDAIMGIDFLYAYHGAVNLSRSHLVLRAHPNPIIPLYGPHRKLSQHGVLWAHCILELHQLHSLPVVLLFESMSEWTKAACGVPVADILEGRNDLFIPAQRVIHTVEVVCTGGNHLYFAKGTLLVRWHSLPLEGRTLFVALLEKTVPDGGTTPGPNCEKPGIWK